MNNITSKSRQSTFSSSINSMKHVKDSKIILLLNNNLGEIYASKISYILKRINMKNESQKLSYSNSNSCKAKHLKYFELLSAPALSFEKYLNKLVFPLTSDSSTIVYSLILLDRFINSGLIINETNQHLSFFISFIIATKLQEDLIYEEHIYCKYGGLTKLALAKLEKIFLESIDYNIYVTAKEYNFYLKNFCN